jgi:TfoX/Sxy family transcriptional regulator of competence genes
MGSRRETVDYLLEQLSRVDEIRALRMFGEFGIYAGDKFVALLCDDELYVKATAAGRAYFPDCVERAPFPGAKPWLLVPGERWEEPHWLCELIALTARELLPVQPKRRSRRLVPGAR